jgi:hypothetical protein
MPLLWLLEKSGLAINTDDLVKDRGFGSALTNLFRQCPALLTVFVTSVACLPICRLYGACRCCRLLSPVFRLPACRPLVCLSAHLPVCLPDRRLPACLPFACISACLSALCLPICLSMCRLPTCLPECLPIMPIAYMPA